MQGGIQQQQGRGGMAQEEDREESVACLADRVDTEQRRDGRRKT